MKTLLVLLFSLPLQAAPPAEISKESVIAWIKTGPGASCLEIGTGDVHIDEEDSGRFILVDLDNDGVREAVVDASTCEAGNSGPNIHVVLKLGKDGKLSEVPFVQTPALKLPLPMVGTSSSILGVDNKKRVYREYLLQNVKLFYEWKNGTLVGVAVAHPKIGKPSFRCTAKVSDLEKAICWDEKISQSDREAERLYKMKWKAANADRKKELEKERTAWIEKRNDQCDVFKWHISCLEEMYEKRLISLTEKN